MVRREDKRIENVPRTKGSGFHEWYCGPLGTVVFAILFAMMFELK
jgi:hypothetical protein